MTSSNSDQVVFNPREHVPALTSRDAGSLARDALLDLHARTPAGAVIRITIDAEELMTPSFVDEFFGRVVSQLGLSAFRARFTIDPGTDENRTFINNVVRNRMLLDHGRIAG